MTSNYLSLTTFVPGTKAKASEVNSNFEILKDAIMTKALLEGDSSQTFSVAQAKEDYHAVTKSQLEDAKSELVQTFATYGYKFCIRSGNTTNGIPDLFQVTNLSVTPKIGGTYPDLIFADYKGNVHTISSADSFTLQGKQDGTYNIFINKEGNIYTLANTIYSKQERPQLVDDDIWLDTSCEDFKCIKLKNGSDEEFLDIPIGAVTIKDGLIAELKTVKYLNNGFDVTYNNLPDYKYDFANPISKTFGTTYTAECDGLLHLVGFNVNVAAYLMIEGVRYTIHTSSSQGSIAGGFAPIKKGQTYSASAGSEFKFVPKVEF